MSVWSSYSPADAIQTSLSVLWAHGCYESSRLAKQPLRSSVNRRWGGALGVEGHPLTSGSPTSFTLNEAYSITWYAHMLNYISLQQTKINTRKKKKRRRKSFKLSFCPGQDVVGLMLLKKSCKDSDKDWAAGRSEGSRRKQKEVEIPRAIFFLRSVYKSLEQIFLWRAIT